LDRYLTKPSAGICIQLPGNVRTRTETESHVRTFAVMENGSQGLGPRLARLCFIAYSLRLQRPKKLS
jgi:hypothetical protein